MMGSHYRYLTFRSSNSHLVQVYMSKQMDAKGMLTNEQYELARILYQLHAAVA